jgi:hypothetical protein
MARVPSVVQNQNQGDANLRAAIRSGGPLPFQATRVRQDVQPQQRLQAQERRRVPKGFAAGRRGGGNLLQMLAQMFMSQRR